MKKNQGFTLIELMIVVEIIAIIAAIAIPNYLRTRIQANEAAAIANLRVILDAQTNYNTQYYEYTDDLNELTNAEPPFLEGGDWTVPRGGFQYRLEGGGGNFAAYATPVEWNVTGWNGFRIDASAAIRYQSGSEPDGTSALISGT